MKKEPLTNFINNYELKSALKQIINIPQDILITQHTIQKYMIKHSNTNMVYFDSIKKTLQKIRKQDKIVRFYNNKIYFHTYRILLFIEQHIKALDFYNSTLYTRHSFAKQKSDKNKIEREYHKHKANAFDLSNAFTGDDKIKALILKHYLTNNKMMDILLNFYTVFPQGNINYTAMEKNDKVITIVKKVFKYFESTYISSEDVIFKSLAIVLNSYFRLKMNMQASYAKIITQELLLNLFNYEFKISSENLLNSIYISGRINNLPIFKNSSKNELYSDETKEQFTHFIQTIQKDFSDIEHYNLDANEFFHANPIYQYFQQYPREFLHKIK